MTGVQTCALPICFPVTISRALDEFEHYDARVATLDKSSRMID